MADSQGRSGAFAAISIVALLFMVLGITIAVLQMVSYSDSQQPPPGTLSRPPEPNLRVGEETEDTEGEDGVGEGETDVEDGEGDDEEDVEEDDEEPGGEG